MHTHMYTQTHVRKPARTHTHTVHTYSHTYTHTPHTRTQRERETVRYSDAQMYRRTHRGCGPPELSFAGYNEKEYGYLQGMCETLKTVLKRSAPDSRRGCGWESLMKSVTLGNVTMSHRTKRPIMICVSQLNYDRSAER
ncbi:hypothetical protein EVAR_41759_1 [Eumeta japonica]|uniref:Uncharacterized protein n=1 Tax=Eumeta variegata TaxID=151549 RepID=A0A4C1VYM5_EUMVA|nr:hypothetical protein EVAR_41759_1 [Eumeta japonica]